MLPSYTSSICKNTSRNLVFLEVKISLPLPHHTQNILKNKMLVSVGIVTSYVMVTMLFTLLMFQCPSRKWITQMGTLRRGFGKGCRETANTHEVGITGLPPDPKNEEKEQPPECERRITCRGPL